VAQSKKTIAIFGASGFLGSSIVLALNQSNYRLKLFSRNKEKIKYWTVNPDIQIFDFDLDNLTQVKKDLKNTDVVINLLGILHQSKKDSFDKIHHLWLSHLANMMKDLGIKRLIHLSALGASFKAPSLYLKSKAHGETALLNQKDLNLTILRPSIISLNKPLSYIFALSMEILPIKILTRDNWRSMQVSNVVDPQYVMPYRYSQERLEHYLENKKNRLPMRTKYNLYRSKSGR